MNLKPAEELQKYSKESRILYVEDDLHLLEATKSFLGNFFKDIDTANNGKEALVLYENDKYDIVISDINMPSMNGIELCRIIKEQCPEQQILITSAHEESGYLFELINMGVDKFVSKPFEMKFFIASLLKLCKNSWQKRELRNYHNNLEKMVEIKTEEIKQSNEKLEKLNHTLEVRVEEEVAKSRHKDELLLQQARHSAMEDVLSHIAHQWRQPLNGVALTVQHIALLVQDEVIDYEKIDGSIDEILDLLENTSKTIDDFRDFFKPQGEKNEFVISEVIQRTTALLQSRFEEDNITLDVNNISNSTLYGYPQELSQTLFNLLNNSHEAFIKNKVEERKIEIFCELKEQKVYIHIADNAGGIDSTHVQHIFDPYFTTEFECSSKGIGLYLTKILVEHYLKGDITVNSLLSGTKFQLILPIHS